MRKQNDQYEQLVKKLRGSKRAQKAKPKMKVSGSGVKDLARIISQKRGR